MFYDNEEFLAKLDAEAEAEKLLPYEAPGIVLEVAARFPNCIIIPPVCRAVYENFVFTVDVSSNKRAYTQAYFSAHPIADMMVVVMKHNNSSTHIAFEVDTYLQLPSADKEGRYGKGMQT